MAEFDDDESDSGDGLLILNSNIAEVEIMGTEILSTTLIGSLIASLATLNFGYALGFPSPVQADIEKNNKGVGFLTKEEFSWFEALICIGAIIGIFVDKFYLAKVGPKVSILLTTFFYVPGWCLIIMGNHPVMFFIGRIFSGIGVGMSSLSVSRYISEIASPNYRGGLVSLQQLSVTVGVFFAFLCGSCLPWQWSAIVPLLISGVMVTLMILMPETPRYSLAHNRKHKALSTLRWLRGSDYDVESEIERIEENLESEGSEHFRFSVFWTRSLYQPLLIGVVMMVMRQLCGINAVIGYCESILTSAHIRNVSLISVIVSMVQIMFTFSAYSIVDKSGQRILLMIGGLVMACCMFILGVYYDITVFNDGKNHIDIFDHRTVTPSSISWLAALCVLTYIAFFSISWGPLPWKLISELFPPIASDTAGVFASLINWLSGFLVMKFYPQMHTAFGGQGVFWFYAGCSFLSVLFTLFFIPETEGKSLEEIQQYFTRKTGNNKEFVLRKKCGKECLVS